MTSDNEAKKRRLPSFFLPTVDDEIAHALIQQHLDEMEEQKLNALLIRNSSSFWRKYLQSSIHKFVQDMVDYHGLFMQWSDTSDEAAALRNAYSDMVLLGLTAEAAAAKASAELEDLKWLIKRRPPEKADKEQFKPVPPRKSSGKKGSTR